jgi:hypothetical protein
VGNRLFFLLIVILLTFGVTLIGVMLVASRWRTCCEWAQAEAGAISQAFVLK